MLIHEALRFAHDRDEVYAILEQALAVLPRTERCDGLGDAPPRSVDEVQRLFSHLFFRLDRASRILNEPTCRALKDAIQSCGLALQRLHALDGAHAATLTLPPSPADEAIDLTWARHERQAPVVSRSRRVTAG